MSNLSKLINYYLPIRDFLYILQLEEYEISRYLRQASKRLFKRNFEVRDHLNFTTRIKATYALTLGFCIAPLYLISDLLFFTLYLLALPLLTPYVIAVLSPIVGIFVSIARKMQIAKAHEYFTRTYPNTKIIAVTGSYGKTTTKYLLHALLEHTFTTFIIPKNINTTLGVANYILNKSLPSKTEYFIVEMGAYTRGDIKELALLLPPDIAIITKLGDQHLERFGSFENLVHAKYEIFQYAKEHAKKFTTKEALRHIEENELPATGITSIETEQNETSNVTLACAVASDLGVRADFIADALEHFSVPERRDETYTQDGVTVIDNSYNISPQTADILIKKARTVADSMHKKLVVMTGGIGEQGTKSNTVNEQFGELLSLCADRVILNPTIYADAILSTLTKPHTIVEVNKTVIDDVSNYVNGETEILLFLTGQTDLGYI